MVLSRQVARQNTDPELTRCRFATLCRSCDKLVVAVSARRLVRQLSIGSNRYARRVRKALPSSTRKSLPFNGRLFSPYRLTPAASVCRCQVGAGKDGPECRLVLWA